MIISSRELNNQHHWAICFELVLIRLRALYIKGDPYETSDAVFGVKDDLVVEVGKVDNATAEKYGVKEGSALITWDFVLVSVKEADELRDQKSIEVLKKLGRQVKIVDGLPVPDVD
jgi:hypothetical protein